jgi:hypothetical protein
MTNRTDELRQRLKTPRAAAVAGILFSSLTIGTQLLIRSSIPASRSAREVLSHSSTLLLALNLVPFAGISFLRFIGVFRDHLGEYEDRLLVGGIRKDHDRWFNDANLRTVVTQPQRYLGA